MSKKVYDNRELSWLKFNMRVLEEAQDSSVPIMERLKFASIYSSNLDEFFMVRVGALIDQKLYDDDQKDTKTKLRPSEQINEICSRVAKLAEHKDKTFATICSELELKGVSKRSFKSLNKSELDFVERYYSYEIEPMLNAVIIDRKHPFPFLGDKELFVCAKLASKSGLLIGLISCTGKFERIVFLPGENGQVHYMLAEDIISAFADRAFSSYKIEERAVLRLTRSADISLDDDFDIELDARQNMSELISKRKRLRPVRMQLSRALPDEVINELCSRLELSAKQIFIEKAPLDLGYVFALCPKCSQRSEMFYSKREPQPSRMIDESRPMIPQIEERDLLLSYPYESMKPFLRLLDEAAADPEVTSIKMTLYRVAKNSRVIKSLCTAAENGKDVFVLVELRARFDEENNIEQSRQLEEAGCTVVYGPAGFKVHSKLCLITYKTAEGTKYITQIGTGNYNEKTAELYTDFSVMTANGDIAQDACDVFKALSMGETVDSMRLLWAAPHCLQNRAVEMMDNEIRIARAGGEGYVGLKLNSLTDKVLIDKLIECSQAGVKVELVIRGISCLAAGIKGVTDNIRLISIVGRYLEHGRIYIFGEGVRRNIYISSADFMTRNTTRRVEIAAPILDEQLKERLTDYFNVQFSDNVKAREQLSDRSYIHVSNDNMPLDAQKHFIAEAYANVPKTKPVPVPEPEKKKGFFARLFGRFRRKK
ncbi:MAG: polyphosphate kinase 1 [Ruminococcus sp.]|nr:polyphosphate kinase 1 [Ruminococcus sp.]